MSIANCELILMACPICVSPEGTAMTAGIQAGAGVLILVTLIVLALIGRFAFQLWAADGADCAEKPGVART